jgi:hypothetical protein
MFYKPATVSHWYRSKVIRALTVYVPQPVIVTGRGDKKNSSNLPRLENCSKSPVKIRKTTPALPPLYCQMFTRYQSSQLGKILFALPGRSAGNVIDHLLTYLEADCILCQASLIPEKFSEQDLWLGKFACAAQQESWKMGPRSMRKNTTLGSNLV